LSEVQTIAVRIGALSSVNPEALRFGFTALTQDTPLAQTELAIEMVPVQGRCRNCERELEVRDLVFACPFCGPGQIAVAHGEELDINDLEVAEE